MDIQNVLLKLGIPTFMYCVETALTANQEVKIGDTLEVSVGWIYGMSVNVMDTLPANNTVNNITTVQASRLFINLKFGQSIYVNKLRLDHLVFNDPSATTAAAKFTNPNKFLQVNIPGMTDLKQSFYSNPTLLNANTIGLNLFYIDLDSYNYLVANKVIGKIGVKP